MSTIKQLAVYGVSRSFLPPLSELSNKHTQHWQDSLCLKSAATFPRKNIVTGHSKWCHLSMFWHRQIATTYVFVVAVLFSSNECFLRQKLNLEGRKIPWGWTGVEWEINCLCHTESRIESGPLMIVHTVKNRKRPDWHEIEAWSIETVYIVKTWYRTRNENSLTPTTVLTCQVDNSHVFYLINGFQFAQQKRYQDSSVSYKHTLTT